MSSTSSTTTLPRRRVLLGGLGATAVALLAACSPAPPSPTSAPARPTAAAAQPAAQPATPAPAKPPAQPATPAPAPTKAAPAAAKALKKFKLVYTFPQFLYAYLYSAKEQGFFERAGLDVELTSVESDATGLKALLAKEVDLLDATCAGMLASVEQGSDLKVIGVSVPKTHFMLFAKKTINNVADLAGKTMAISAPNALPHVLALAVLHDANVDASTVTFVPLGAQGMVPALVAGTVDSATAPFQWQAVVEKEPNLHVAFAYKDKVPKMVNSSLIVASDSLKTRADDLAAAMTGVLQGIRFVLDPKNKAEVSQAVVKYASMTPQDVDYNWKWFQENRVWDPNGVITPDQIQYMQQVNNIIGTQKQAMPFDRVASLDIQKRVIQSLGEYKG